MKMNKYITIKETPKQVMLNLFQHLFIRPRNKFGVTLLTLLLAFSLISCVNNIQPNEISEDTTTTAEPGIAYITLCEPTFGNNSRTIAPDETVDYNSSNLSNLVFSAHQSDGAGNNIGTEIILASAAALSGLSGKKIPIEPGTYNLKLTATLSGAPMEGIILNKTISSGLNTSISFQLKAPSDFIWGGCNLSITFNNSDNKISKVTITLKKCNKVNGTETLDGTKTLIETKEYNSSDFEGSGSTKTIKYMRNVANELERLEYGYYYITFDFYKIYDAPDNRTDLLNSISQYMYIDKGHWTTWTSTSLNYNDVYSITYKYYADDVEDTSFTPSSGLVFPAGFSSRSEELVIPAVSKEDYTFLGWYTDSTFTTRLPENASNQQIIAAGSTGSKDLYARFIKPELYVSSSATDDTGTGFTEAAAFKTFGAAISKINTFTTPFDWTIHIIGEVDMGTDDYKISNFYPEKLILAGKDDGTSKLKATSDNQNSVLWINDEDLEVEITNLTLTGCLKDVNQNTLGGGITIEKGTCTLSDGAIVTGNTAAYGDGIYVKPTGGILKIKGTAKVASDDTIYYYSNDSIIISDSLTGTYTDPVATIELQNYNRTSAIVSAGTSELLAASYNRFLILPKTTEGVTTMYKVGSDGKITDYLAAGDIVFSDQTVMTYTSGLSFSDDAKARAVGVIYLYISPTDPVVIPRGILGKVNTYHDDTTKLGWVNRSEGNPVTNYDTELVCSVTGEDYSEGGKTLSSAAVAEGDSHDGSTHASLFRSKDSSSTYATLDYADSYGTTNFADTSFANGWYIPSVAEMITIGKQKETLNTILTAIGGTTLGYEYWTSSLSNSSDNYGIWSVGMVHNNVYLQPFHYGNNACCVHQY